MAGLAWRVAVVSSPYWQASNLLRPAGNARPGSILAARASFRYYPGSWRRAVKRKSATAHNGRSHKRRESGCLQNKFSEVYPYGDMPGGELVFPDHPKRQGDASRLTAPLRLGASPNGIHSRLDALPFEFEDPTGL